MNLKRLPPDPGGYDFWLTVIKSNPDFVEEVLVAFSESAEKKQQVAQIISNGFE